MISSHLVKGILLHVTVAPDDPYHFRGSKSAYLAFCIDQDKSALETMANSSNGCPIIGNR